MRWQCTACDDWHEGLPALVVPVPDYVLSIPEAEREARCVIEEEFCAADEHRFVRGVLRIPVVGEDERLEYVVWLSLSPQNAERYRELGATGESSDDLSFVGWLSNEIHGFPGGNLAGRLRIRGAGLRPLIELEPTEHPLSVAQGEGVAISRAADLVAPFLHW